jgi:triose/dihydroxyacetone kinase / FAD-AMP lyase (cyclizing)
MPKPKNIINEPKDAVSEFVDGLLLQYPNHLSKLENHHVVLINATQKNRWTSQSVQLICGGGSGHEPSHAGYVGTGMLAGAVCGGIFASPSVASILAAIRAVHASAPDKSNSTILLIIKNYTGDRLNFGMAAEKANQEGIVTSLHIVADDCALPRTKGITGARGVAGTVLVNKIAGAAAASGKSLEDVLAVAKLVSSRIGSLGIALSSVTIPGALTTNDRLNNDSIIEIGLGIHGEAGMKQSPLLSANEMARTMITTIQDYGCVEADETVVPLFQNGDELCVLVNNLGGASNFEMSILARACITTLESSDYNAKVTRVLVGSYMTSFDMHGVSLTIFNLQNQPQLISYLDAPCNAPAWTTLDVWSNSGSRASATMVSEVKVDESNASAAFVLPPVIIDNFAINAKKMLQAAVEQLQESESLLTQYDTIVGDGDCGITMQRGAKEILQRLENGVIPMNHPVTMFAGIADAVSDSMGGTSGVLIELMMRKISSTLRRASSITSLEVATAFQAGVDAVSLYGGAAVGSRTMLDALVPAASSLVLTSGTDLTVASVKARAGANSTASMELASAGRSNYLSAETLKGTPDPGAIAVAIVLEAMSLTS